MRIILSEIPYRMINAISLPIVAAVAEKACCNGKIKNARGIAYCGELSKLPRMIAKPMG